MTDPQVPRQATQASAILPEAAAEAGVLTLAPGAGRGEHRSPGPVVLEVLSGAGTLRTATWGDRGLLPGNTLQLPAGEPHALTAGPEGLVLRVRRIAPCCEQC